MHPAQRQKTSGWYVKLFKRHYTSLKKALPFVAGMSTETVLPLVVATRVTGPHQLLPPNSQRGRR